MTKMAFHLCGHPLKNPEPNPKLSMRKRHETSTNLGTLYKISEQHSSTQSKSSKGKECVTKCYSPEEAAKIGQLNVM